MIKSIKEKNPKSKIEIDLTGPDGNAFSLMAYATDFCKQLGIDNGRALWGFYYYVSLKIIHKIFLGLNYFAYICSILNT